MLISPKKIFTVNSRVLHFYPATDVRSCEYFRKSFFMYSEKADRRVRNTSMVKNNIKKTKIFG